MGQQADLRRPVHRAGGGAVGLRFAAVAVLLDHEGGERLGLRERVGVVERAAEEPAVVQLHGVGEHEQRGHHGDGDERHAPAKPPVHESEEHEHEHDLVQGAGGPAGDELQRHRDPEERHPLPPRQLSTQELQVQQADGEPAQGIEHMAHRWQLGQRRDQLVQQVGSEEDPGPGPQPPRGCLGPEAHRARAIEDEPERPVAGILQRQTGHRQREGAAHGRRVRVQPVELRIEGGQPERDRVEDAVQRQERERSHGAAPKVGEQGREPEEDHAHRQRRLPAGQRRRMGREEHGAPGDRRRRERGGVGMRTCDRRRAGGPRWIPCRGGRAGGGAGPFRHAGSQLGDAHVRARRG